MVAGARRSPVNRWPLPQSVERCDTIPPILMADEQRAAIRESADEELTRLRRLAVVEQLLPTLVGVLDLRDVLTRVSEGVGHVLAHDALALPSVSEDRQEAIPFASSEFEIVDDLQSEPDRDRQSASLGYRSILRVPVRLENDVVALLVIQSRAPAAYRPADALVARRIADYIALALSHERLAEQARQAEVLRARTATLELLDSMLADLIDNGPLPEVFDRISAIARKVVAHDMLLMVVATADGRHARTYACSGDRPFQVSDVWDIPSEVLQQPEWGDEICDDMSTHPVWRRYDAPKRGYRSSMQLMIRFDGALVGSLAFFSFAPAAYMEADLFVARRIRDRFALSLARERGNEASKQADEAAARASVLEARVRALTEELNARSGYRRVVGNSPSWRQALTEATQVAATETTVLLQGESGTGKEVVARFVHRASPRRDGPFVALNCAALPEQLLEAELFGYERGAFTGATQSKPGQLEQAAGGVLFLDEVAEMSVAAQAKFLRVLQEREFQRLGGTRVLKTDARIVAATNRDLRKAMERGQFREDLYYRLNVFAIHLPPLRERRDDVLPLTEAFIQEIGRSIGRPPAGVSREAREALLDYHWPGNVRELRNILERAAILCDGGLITAQHLALGPPPAPPPAVHVMPPAVASPPAPVALPTDLKSAERALIAKALQDAHFNKSEAARALGLTRAQLYVRLRKHGLEKDNPGS